MDTPATAFHMLWIVSDISSVWLAVSHLQVSLGYTHLSLRSTRFLSLSPKCEEDPPRRKTHRDFPMISSPHAHPRYGYVNVTDMKAMGKLAEFLTLEPDVVSKEMKVASSEKTHQFLW